jgi:predicted GNAT family acetyltransferase
VAKVEVEVQHNEAANRFEAEVNGQLAVAEYIRAGEQIIFTHTEVPEELEGQGVASQLISTALDHAR